MNLLPVELIEGICQYVPEKDIPSVRLASRALCNVATRYLMRDIHLIFKLNSFHRLLAISQHPIISREITSLFYEPDSLDTYHSKKKWQKEVCEVAYVKKPMSLDNEAHELCTSEDMDRMRKRSKYEYSKETLADGWASYRSLYNQQEYIRQQGYGFLEIYDAMKGLPNLNDITMSLESAIVPRSRYVDKAFDASLILCGSGDQNPNSCGIPQLRSLLLGASRAGLSLRRVQAGVVDWKFLKATESDFAKIKKALKSLTFFEIFFTTGFDDANDMFGVEIPECYEYLRNSRLWHLIKDSPSLETIAIAFDCNEPHSPVHFDSVVQDTKWDHLTTVDFKKIDTDEESWITFYLRHQDTLRDVRFEYIRLLSGDWISTLTRMHDALKLISASVRGSLLAEDPPQHWFLDYRWREEEDDEQTARTRKAIDDYLTGWGDCPLLDEDGHPQTWLE